MNRVHRSRPARLPAPPARAEAAAVACRYLGLEVLDALREHVEFAGEPVALHFARRRLRRGLAELQGWLAYGAEAGPQSLAFRREGEAPAARLNLVPVAAVAADLLAGRLRIEDAGLPLWRLAPRDATPGLEAEGAPILFGGRPLGVTRLAPEDARAVVRASLALTPAWRALRGLFDGPADARAH
jgi:hypothetical protein